MTQSGILEAEDTRRDRKACVSLDAFSSEDHVWFEDRWMVPSLCDE
jgi:hypothetical protein